jgi:hypothetical protein
MTTLKGAPALKRRLKAIRESFKPIGRNWADDTARIARSKVPVRTGRLRKSIRRKNASQRKATVAAHFTAFFIDPGTKAHDIKARKAGTLVFQGRGGTIFAKKVHKRAYKGKPFRKEAATEALRRNPMAEELIRQWNQAA